MTADENNVPELPEFLPVDKDSPVTGDEEPFPVDQRLASPTDVTGVDIDTSASESRRPVLRIANPDVNPNEQTQAQDPVTDKQDLAEIENSTDSTRDAATGKALSIYGISTSTKESLGEGEDTLVPSTFDVNSTADEPHCCSWCPDPTRSKLPAEDELQVYSLTHWSVTTQEVMENEDEAEEKAEDNSRREQAIIEWQGYLHRRALNERSGGGPSNFQDDGTADTVPHWGLQYPDPPAGQSTAPPQSQEIGPGHSEAANHSQALSQHPGTNPEQSEVATQPTALPQIQEIGPDHSKAATDPQALSKFPRTGLVQPEVATQSVAPLQSSKTNSVRPEAAVRPPTPSPPQEAISARPRVGTQAPVSARKGITFGNIPSPRRSREVDRADSDRASEDPPAYSLEKSGCKEISRRLISEGGREETDYGARRPAVKDLKPGKEPATANGRPIVGLGAGQIIKSKPRRSSIVSQEVMPEEVVVDSDLENDEHITRPLAAYNIDGVRSSGPREEIDENQPHVEHEEDVGTSASSTMLEEADQNPPLVENQRDIKISASSGPLNEAGEDYPHVEHEEDVGNSAGSATLEQADQHHPLLEHRRDIGIAASNTPLDEAGENRPHVEHEEDIGNTAGRERLEEAEENRPHVEHEETVENTAGSESREEAGENRPHVEHEESVGTLDGNGNVQNGQARFVRKAKKFFKINTWKKPRKERKD